MRPGVRIGVDVGRARVGVARSDAHAMLATPVETVPRARRGSDDIDRILAISAECDAMEIIVGSPIALSGASTDSTRDAHDFALRLARETPIPVRLVDERLSTVSAHSALRSAGRRTRSHRPVVDQVAAVIILQHGLDAERALDRPPGSRVPADESN